MTVSVPTDPEQVVTLDMQQMPQAAFLVDMNQRIVMWNRAAELLLGRRAQDVVGRRCFEVMSADGAGAGHPCAPDCPVIVNARRNRGTRALDASVAEGHHGRHWVSMSSTVVRTGAGHKRLMHVLRDATRVYELDQTIARAVTHAQVLTADPHPEPVHTSPAPASSPDSSGTHGLLTQRESQVLHLLVRGLSTNQIADTLGVSRVTARNHVTNLMEKLNAATRLQAVVIAAEMGLL
jgi:PAS domain S-box-containing protein